MKRIITLLILFLSPQGSLLSLEGSLTADFEYSPGYVIVRNEQRYASATDFYTVGGLTFTFTNIEASFANFVVSTELTGLSDPTNFAYSAIISSRTATDVTVLAYKIDKATGVVTEPNNFEVVINIVGIGF